MGSCRAGALASIALTIATAAGCGSASSSARAPSTTQPGAGPAGAPATPAEVARCTPRGAHVVAIDRDAVVYTVPHTFHGGPGPGATTHGVAIYGCLVASRRRVRLQTAANVGKVALKRTTVAYSTSQVEGVDTVATNITVAEISPGRRLYTVPAGNIAIAPRFVTVDALAVAPAGAVAWIQHGGSTESPGYSVYAAAQSKPQDHRLASGTGINPRSLRLEGDTVSWVDGGQRRSARI